MEVEQEEEDEDEEEEEQTGRGLQCAPRPGFFPLISDFKARRAAKKVASRKKILIVVLRMPGSPPFVWVKFRYQKWPLSVEGNFCK